MEPNQPELRSIYDWLNFRNTPYNPYIDMELRLPAKFSDLKLRHLQALETESDPIRRLDAVTGIGVSKLREMPHPLIMQADAHLQTLLSNDVSNFKRTFELKGTRYGFVPNWEEFTAGEWIDMEVYTQDFWKTAHKAMSVLYRPIDREFGDAYTVEKYTAKEDADVFLEMPAPYVAGALLFFWTTERKLLSTSRKSLAETAVMAMSLLRSGDGTPRSTPWQGKTYSRWSRFLLSLRRLFSRISPSSKTLATSGSNK